MRAIGRSRPFMWIVAAMALMSASMPVQAQRGRGTPPPTGRENAPFDPSGYWVSLITEDWRFRMLTPPKGDYESVPLNAEGRKVADAWDPARDEAIGEQCRSYGAPAIMRVPGRLHITWEDPTTLRIDTDAGQQTRLFHFQGTRPAQASPSWQGVTAASWERDAIKAVTTGLRAGYLRKNGVPYSENVLLTEYIDKASMPDRSDLLVVSTVVADPRYLTTDFITSSHFRREATGAKWNPTPCVSR
jgi:hypothetical protein